MSELYKNGTLKAAVVYGSVTLASAFIGVWGGREVVNVELRVLQASVAQNTADIKETNESIRQLTGSVVALNAVAAERKARIERLEDDMSKLRNRGN